MKISKSALRVVGFLEGLSFVLLLGVGMPLKYLYDLPLAVRILGSIHGLLFVLFVAFVLEVSGDEDWPKRQKLHAFLASVLPFGTFWFDGKYLATRPAPSVTS